MRSIKRRIDNLELRNARGSFFSDIIAKNSNYARSLFVTVDRLTNPPVSVTPELLSNQACNEFAFFFTDKIQKIMQSVRASMPGTGHMSSLCPLKDVKTMTHFSLISPKNLDEIICHLKTITCCLDTCQQGFSRLFQDEYPQIFS